MKADESLNLMEDAPVNCLELLLLSFSLRSSDLNAFVFGVSCGSGDGLASPLRT